MSRTDKDRPSYVKRFDETLGSYVQHNHRSGECRVETFDQARAWAGGYRGSWRHYRRCKKREVVTYLCTPQNPEERHSPGSYRRVKCWSRQWVGSSTYDWGYVKLQCPGHRKQVIHPEIPCSCDEPRPEPPTCDWATGSAAGYAWWRHGVPKWYIDNNWNNPERVRERDDLREAVKLANAGELDDDFDFPNFQHGQRAGWHWY